MVNPRSPWKTQGASRRQKVYFIHRSSLLAREVSFKKPIKENPFLFGRAGKRGQCIKWIRLWEEIGPLINLSKVFFFLKLPCFLMKEITSEVGTCSAVGRGCSVWGGSRWWGSQSTLQEPVMHSATSKLQGWRGKQTWYWVHAGVNQLS